MTDINMLCFHTCSNENGKEYILNNAPFHSDTEKLQWLGQGYYLWSDSDIFAHDWGGKYPDGYVIIKCNLTVARTEYFDLVGRVDHQIIFLSYVEQYKEYLRKAIALPKNSGRRSQLEEKLRSISVSSVIGHLRKFRALPFKVVKALDCDSKRTKTFQYMAQGGFKEKMPLPTRQQVVVYPEAKHLLSAPEWHHPEE